MSDTAGQCACVVDTDGLHAIATASGNIKGVLLAHLKSGVIGVPACAWKEFEELYEAEAEFLKGYVPSRIVMKHAYYIGAARIADKLNSGFPRGSYDDNVELITASVASTNGYIILTTVSQIPVYVEMKCKAVDAPTLIESLAPPAKAS